MTLVLPGVVAPLVHVGIARLLQDAPSAVLVDDMASGPAGYTLVTVDVDEQVAAPDDLAAFVPAAEGFGFDAVIVLTWAHGRQQIEVHARRTDREAARAALGDLVAHATGRDNFYRGKTVQVTANDHGVTFTPVTPSVSDPNDLVHAAAV